jgi:hypothetical protein
MEREREVRSSKEKSLKIDVDVIESVKDKMPIF